jgi:hypothetical protein
MWCDTCRRTFHDARELQRLMAALVEHEAVAEYTENPATRED